MNDISFHPVHGTLSTVGSDGKFSFWDKDARTKLRTSEQLDQPIVCSAFSTSSATLDSKSGACCFRFDTADFIRFEDQYTTGAD